MSIGERIKFRREELNMSQEGLAKTLGYKSRSSINKIEKDGRELPQSKIKAIADALQTTPGYIMGWEEKNIKATGSITMYNVNCDTNDECDLIIAYRKLSDTGKKKACSYANGLLDTETAESELKKAQQEKEKIVQLKPQIKQELHYLDVIAAHNDNTDEDQVEKMRRDAMALLED